MRHALVVLVFCMGIVPACTASSEANQPIRFYGLVVDEAGTPVAGAKVRYAVHYAPAIGIPYLTADGHRNSSERSDREGRFEIESSGLHLEIKNIEKSGYFYEPSGLTFAAHSNAGPETTIERPYRLEITSERPVQSLIFAEDESHALRMDGREYTLALQPQYFAEGRVQNGALVISCTGDPAWAFNTARETPADIRCRLTALRGGLVRARQAYPWLAPDAGYLPSLEITAEDIHYETKELRANYYLQQDRQYALVKITLTQAIPSINLHLDYWINPNGSRELRFAKERGRYADSAGQAPSSGVVLDVPPAHSELRQ